MCPQPNSKDIPKYELWNFIHKQCDTTTELVPLAKNIVSYGNQDYSDNTKNDILSFLPSTTNRIDKWSDYWITIIHTLGIGYESNNILYSTALAEYISNNNSIDGFYYYWALRFQYPFRGKDGAFEEAKIAIQPIVFILDHLVALFESALLQKQDPLKFAYLSFDELVLVLMKSKSNSYAEVKNNINKITINRNKDYDYEELKLEGYESYKRRDFSYTIGYLQKFNLIKFKKGNIIYISDWQHYFKIIAFLAFKKPVFAKTIKNENKINFFENAFNKLNPSPGKLLEVVNSLNSNSVFTPETFNINKLIEKALERDGVYFNTEFIEAFLLSIKTKPFVILSGISGVGKSILPRTIMKLIGNSSCTPIAVAPDWTDNTDMLGYFNVDNEFINGEFTSLILEAEDNPHKPYFIVLDEMNLSRVEYYFAQVLSVIESRRYNIDLDKVECLDYLFNKAMRERLLTFSETKAGEEKKLIQKISSLKIPNNVYIIGTVNIDESTYPFSKKVLDRANVLEINDVDLMIGINCDEDELNNIQAEGTESVEIEDNNTDQSQIVEDSKKDGQDEQQQQIVQENSDEEQIEILNLDILLNHFFEGKITNMKELQEQWKLNNDLNLPIKEALTKWVKLLELFNECLKPLKMNIGFRVRDEVCIYMYYAAINNIDILDSEEWWYRYFDQQLVQKILPRIGGEQGELEVILVKLYNLCIKNLDASQEDILSDTVKVENIIFPKAENKLKCMLYDLVVLDKPSTSFWSV